LKGFVAAGFGLAWHAAMPSQRHHRLNAEDAGLKPAATKATATSI